MMKALVRLNLLILLAAISLMVSARAQASSEQRALDQTQVFSHELSSKIKVGDPVVYAVALDEKRGSMRAVGCLPASAHIGVVKHIVSNNSVKVAFVAHSIKCVPYAPKSRVVNASHLLKVEGGCFENLCTGTTVISKFSRRSAVRDRPFPLFIYGLTPDHQVVVFNKVNGDYDLATLGELAAGPIIK